MDNRSYSEEEAPYIERRHEQFGERIRSLKGRIGFVTSQHTTRFIPTDKGINAISYGKPIPQCNIVTVTDVYNFLYATDVQHVVVLGGGTLIDTTRLACNAVGLQPHVVATTASGVAFHKEALQWTEEGIKSIPAKAPLQVFLDPKYSYSVPTGTMVMSSMIALASALDAIHDLSAAATETQKEYAVSSLGSIVRLIPKVIDHDDVAKNNLLLQSSPAAHSIQTCGPGLTHKAALVIRHCHPEMSHGQAAGYAVKGALLTFKRLQQFSPDIFNKTNVEVTKWLENIFVLCKHAKGLADYNLKKRTYTDAIKVLRYDQDVKELIHAAW